jgi:hypothetical protein
MTSAARVIRVSSALIDYNTSQQLERPNIPLSTFAVLSGEILSRAPVEPLQAATALELERFRNREMK